MYFCIKDQQHICSGNLFIHAMLNQTFTRQTAIWGNNQDVLQFFVAVWYLKFAYFQVPVVLTFTQAI